MVPWLGSNCYMLLLTTLLVVLVMAQAQNSLVEVPDEMSNGTLYTISAFTPKVFVKSDTFLLNYTSCAQFHFKLGEKKVRLRAYTCLVAEGGYCTLDKFYYPRDVEGCGKLRPWKHYKEPFAFYFMLEKRPRKYGASRVHKQRKVRRSNTISAQPFGRLTLDGIVPCDEACAGESVVGDSNGIGGPN